MSDNELVYNIKELNLDIINPSTKKFEDPNASGTKTIVIGKPGCFAKGTKVLMFNGDVKNIEDIEIGEQVMGDDSKPRNILELCHNYDTMYKIIPNKGNPIIVNENHILSLKCTGYNNTKKGTILDICLKDFLKKSKTFQTSYKWFRTGIDFDTQKIDLDPYLVGYWLGDGSSYSTAITIEDQEVLDYFDIKLGLFLRQDLLTYRIIQTDGPKHFKNKFLKFLRDNDLIKNKHIPKKYKINSRQIRLQLLAGIIDSDGSYDVDGKGFDITLKSEKLLDDIIFLTRSLGFAAYEKKRTTSKNNHSGTYYRCFISGNMKEVPCIIKRKQAEERRQIKSVLVSGFKIEKLEYGEYFGFTLDDNHRFLLDDFSVVHNTGKSTLIGSLLYAKKHIFPVAMAVSGSEDSNNFYKKIIPSTFVFNEYDPEQIKSFVKRQKIAKLHVENPWAILLLDDCTDDPKIFNSKLQHAIFKKGRHWNTWYILSLQYSMDVKPVIRTNVDGVFVLRESILKNRENLWRNYAGIIPDFKLFCIIMDQITDDFTALYIHNTGTSNNWQDCVFWYKAPKDLPKDFKFGCKDFWKFHDERYNENYTDPFDV
jgi:hypothetical protein